MLIVGTESMTRSLRTLVGCCKQRAKYIILDVFFYILFKVTLQQTSYWNKYIKCLCFCTLSGVQGEQKRSSARDSGSHTNLPRTSGLTQSTQRSNSVFALRKNVCGRCLERSEAGCVSRLWPTTKANAELQSPAEQLVCHMHAFMHMARFISFTRP